MSSFATDSNILSLGNMDTIAEQLFAMYSMDCFDKAHGAANKEGLVGRIRRD